MPFFIGKFYNFVLNRRTIAWPSAFDHTGIKWGTIQVFTDDLMGCRIGIGKPAGSLLNLHIFWIRCERKRYDPLVAELLFHFAEINAALVDTCRCTGFEAVHLNTKLLQTVGQIICCLQPVWTGMRADITVNASCLQVGSGTQYNGLAAVYSARIGLNARYRTIFHKDIDDFTLPDLQVILVFQCLSHGIAVFVLICLGAQGMNGRPFRFIQHL